MRSEIHGWLDAVLAKAHVVSHTRRDPRTGAMIRVKDYTDSRTRKMQQKKGRRKAIPDGRVNEMAYHHWMGGHEMAPHHLDAAAAHAAKHDPESVPHIHQEAARQRIDQHAARMEALIPELRQANEAADKAKKAGQVERHAAHSARAKMLSDKVMSSHSAIAKLNQQHFGSDSWSPATPGPNGETTPHDSPFVMKTRAERDAAASGSTGCTWDIQTPEREKIRDEAVEKEIARTNEGVKQERKLYIVLGSPAAGKSTAVNPLAKKYGCREVSADEIKKHLPEYNGGKGAGTVHEESGQLTETKLLPKLFQRGDNIVIEKIGKSLDPLIEMRDNAKKHGYEVHIIFMDLPTHMAAERATRRFYEMGRFVDPHDIYHRIGNKVAKVYNELKSKGGFSGYERYSTDNAEGPGPRAIEVLDGAQKPRRAGIVDLPGKDPLRKSTLRLPISHEEGGYSRSGLGEQRAHERRGSLPSGRHGHGQAQRQGNLDRDWNRLCKSLDGRR